MPSPNRNGKVTCQKCGTETTRLNLAHHKRDVQLEHFIVLKISTSQNVRRLISTFTLQKKITYSKQTKSQLPVVSSNS